MSARALAESAVRDGYAVSALDLFGDADTRAACAQWSPLGEPGSWQLDAARLLPALGALAQRGDVLGWVPGAGFEGRAGLLAQGAQVLPLIGNAGDAVRRARDPRLFFGALDRLGVAHPEVRATAPEGARASGWLRKDALGTGGWHIRRCGAAVATMPWHDHVYVQREAPGTPMSATFIANGVGACILGFNRLTVRRFGTRPHVYCGAVGPVDLPAVAARQVTRAVRELASWLPLHGLGSLDFLLDGDAVSVLEINPRPPATMTLYETCRFKGAVGATHGLMEAHLRACLHGELPLPVAPCGEPVVRGTEIVYSRRTLQIGSAMARELSQWPGAHDLPAAGFRLTTGDPLCTVAATGTDAAEVRRRLTQGRQALLNSLEVPR